MNQPNPITTGRPRGLVAVVLLAVFLACLGWAGLIVYQRTIRPRQAGPTILEAIARDGLDRSLPPATGEVEWFKVADANDVIQQYDAYRRTRGPGGHRIVNLTYYPNMPTMTIQVWRIANDLSSSEYAAAEGVALLKEHLVFPGVPGTPSRDDAPGLTFIGQARGEVTVERRLAGPEGGAMIAKAPAPGNLIPEGALNAALNQVARRQAAGTFTMITNSRAIVSGQLAFTTVHMRPLAKDQVEVVESLPGAGESRMVWHLDAAGGIAGWEEPTRHVKAVRIPNKQLSLYLRNPGVIRATAETLAALTLERAAVRPTTSSRPATRPSPRLGPIDTDPPLLDPTDLGE
ncbi:MAG: hypothetical protein NTV86_20930 [Planctomycetota bacterium]|nr:hypothetical protein [Planctomycetota bacterium]